eukprot:TRINITY_DN10705_c0_g1_i1.p1 TRINITY_DN10705_c0_g1~~TRINITY_DN10705_c0_g1_i1.p1  ORF type:complete len:399 (-),score=21.17 TRINITY_DN10705_c0_g1_i1:26-1222(-)
MGVVLCLSGHMIVQYRKRSSILEAWDLVFTVIYVSEMIMRLTTDGIMWCTHQPRILFESSVTVLAATTTILPRVGIGYDSPRIDALRCMRCVRVLGRSSLIHVYVSALPRIRTSIRMISMLLVFQVYFFAGLGSYTFGGLLRRSATQLIGTTYAASGYYAINFNDFLSSVVTLFHLMLVNNWYVTMEACVVVTSSRWARLFFVAYYIVAAWVVVDVFTSFLIETATETLDELNAPKLATNTSPTPVENLFDTEMPLDDENPESPRPLKRIATYHALSRFTMISVSTSSLKSFGMPSPRAHGSMWGLGAFSPRVRSPRGHSPKGTPRTLVVPPTPGTESPAHVTPSPSFLAQFRGSLHASHRTCIVPPTMYHTDDVGSVSSASETDSAAMCDVTPLPCS